MKTLLAIGLGLILTGCGSSEDVSKLPTSTADFATTDREVGCKSDYSDGKKEDIFNSKYKAHWMEWEGEVALVDNDSVSIDVNGGTQDLSVDFADEKAGYDLRKGERIAVKFVMRREGGCFLPFSGDNAILIGKYE